jgi:hypothetical protein
MLSERHYLDLANGPSSGTTVGDLSQLFDALKRAPTRSHLLVHFHGGLVSHASAERAAESLTRYC